jgi:hypothetical protein
MARTSLPCSRSAHARLIEFLKLREVLPPWAQLERHACHFVKNNERGLEKHWTRARLDWSRLLLEGNEQASLEGLLKAVFVEGRSGRPVSL